MVKHGFCKAEIAGSIPVGSSILYMQKILINTDVGGFSLSLEAKELYLKEKGFSYTVKKNEFSAFSQDVIYPLELNNGFHRLLRDDPVLVRVFEQIGSERFSDLFSLIKMIEIPDSVKWIVCEKDGYEWIAERHRTWNAQ